MCRERIERARRGQRFHAKIKMQLGQLVGNKRTWVTKGNEPRITRLRRAYGGRALTRPGVAMRRRIARIESVDFLMIICGAGRGFTWRSERDTAATKEEKGSHGWYE